MKFRFLSAAAMCASAVFFVCALAAPALAATTLNGAGATFPEPIYAAWMSKYYELKGLKVNYQGIGSSGGINQIKAKTVDFGGSDVPLTPAELSEAALVQFPMVVGGVVPIVNLKGVEPGELRLTPQVLAGIFAGEITQWDSEAITKLNPGIAFPNEPITTVHRADGSGTTWIFTSYLDRVSPSWHEKIGAGKTVAWPGGVGAKGNPGVAAYVQRVDYSIGYVEYAFAVQNQMPWVTLQNRAGRFVAPTMESFQAAAKNADWARAAGFYLVLTDQPGDETWPIVGASFVLIRKEQANAETAKAMLSFFDWCYRFGADAAREKSYVPLPISVVDLVEAMWKTDVTAAGRPVWK
jgi:phosphate transport system substrate-binding protein